MFQPITPYRNSDTRGFGGRGPAANTIHEFGLDPARIPANCNAVALNIAIVNPVAPGFITVWPDGSPPPDTSVVNYPADGGAHNGSIVCGVVNRKFSLRLSTQAHVIVDVSGFWTP
jgi:hypothetical protein